MNSGVLEKRHGVFMVDQIGIEMNRHESSGDCFSVSEFPIIARLHLQTLKCRRGLKAVLKPPEELRIVYVRRDLLQPFALNWPAGRFVYKERNTLRSDTRLILPKAGLRAYGDEVAERHRRAITIRSTSSRLTSSPRRS
jgi:hypothetical protein